MIGLGVVEPGQMALLTGSSHLQLVGYMKLVQLTAVAAIVCLCMCMCMCVQVCDGQSLNAYILYDAWHKR